MSVLTVAANDFDISISKAPALARMTSTNGCSNSSLALSIKKLCANKLRSMLSLLFYTGDKSKKREKKCSKPVENFSHSTPGKGSELVEKEARATSGRN